jgi:SAM-dependent methyltransferase
MSATYIPPERVEWLTEFLFDTTGRVFRYEGEIYRAIYPQAVARVEALFTSGVIDEVVASKLLVPTERTALSLEGYGLVLKHRHLPFITAATEWCRSFLREAGRVYLDLNTVLARHGLCTIDAHPGNYGQMGCCRPVWLDFGSITPLESADAGLAQFRRFFTNPLTFAAKNAVLTRFTRAINFTGGISDEELAAIGESDSLANRVASAIGSRLRSILPREKNAGADSGARISLLDKHREELDAFVFPELETTWGDYHPASHLEGDVDLYGTPRRAAILRTIERLKPRRVIDLASNAGFYSVFAAKTGAEVLAVDYDEAAVERLFAFSRTPKAEGLQITCACCDVTRPTVLRNPMPREADLVLALALTHHLALGQKCTFSKIASLLAPYCSDSLLVEFMPCGLGGNVPKPDPLPTWYNLENFMEALRTHFGSIEIVAENKEPQWRVLILARNPKRSPSDALPA